MKKETKPAATGTAPSVDLPTAQPVQPPAPPEPTTPPAPPEPTKPVSEENLLSTDSQPAPESGTKIVEPSSLLDGEQFQSAPGETVTQATIPGTSDNGELGCQCFKCKSNPEKRDKRGRHHKSCPCKVCNPAPSFADITTVEKTTDYQLLAETTFDMSTGILTMVFGDEWKARSPEERTSVVLPLKAYLQSKEVKDIPPGLMLTIVAVAYAAPRFQAPSTKQKLSLAWAWCKMKFGTWFKKKKS